MRELLNLCNEDMAWLVFVINGFVIFGEMCLLCRKLPWDFEYTSMRIVLSLVFWYAFLFPLKNKENKS